MFKRVTLLATVLTICLPFNAIASSTQQLFEGTVINNGKFYLTEVTAEQNSDYQYTITSGEAQITKYTGIGGFVTIPSILGGVPVTSISNNAFWGLSGLIGVSIPEGVTMIGNDAFSYCNNLTSVNLPQGLRSIGWAAFNHCTALTTINIPEGVTTIARHTFGWCSNLTTINIPGSVTSLDIGVFSHTGLTSVSIPQGVSVVNEDAFSYCKDLKNITFDSEITQIVECESTIPTTTKIIGYANSAAKDYAVKYNRTFELISQPVIPDTSGMTEIKLATSIVNPSKIWTIKLSGVVEESSVYGNIYTTNSKGIKQIPTCVITTANGRSKIEVKPTQNYASDEYILWIDGIMSVNETEIKRPVFMKFSVGL